jgi:hypothetical protein
MSKWRAYGQAVHPKKWWEIALCEYFKIIHPDKTENYLKVISTSKHLIVFEMKYQSEQVYISKKTIIETISPELN